MKELKVEKRTYSIAEAAKVLGVSQNLMYTLTKRADFPVFPVGSRKLIPIKAFHEWIENQVGGTTNEN